MRLPSVVATVISCSLRLLTSAAESNSRSRSPAFTFTPSSITQMTTLLPSSSLFSTTLSRLCIVPDDVMPIVSGPSATANVGTSSPADFFPRRRNTAATAAQTAIPARTRRLFLDFFSLIGPPL